MDPADLFTVDRKRALNAANEAMALVYGKLTDAQRLTLILLSKGYDCGQAGEMCGTTANTQASHRKAVYRKLEVDSAPEAAVIAAKAGLV